MKGLYIHIPFCQQKCAYCNFISFTSGDIRGYIAALKAEIEMTADGAGADADTVFIGGGTPSVIPAALIADVMGALSRHFNISEGAEITIEANPGTIDIEKLAQYRDAGINRISFGLQSADAEELKMLGRIHTLDDFIAGYNAARAVGFQNINVDLIFGLPKQTIGRFIQTLETVIAVEPEHISCYALKLEPGTPLYRQYDGSGEMPDEDTEREMYHRAIDGLAEAGYEHYETSNFAKPGFACRHNLKYWQGEEYLGFGVAAHGYYRSGEGMIRVCNTDNLNAYIQALDKGRIPKEEELMLSEAEIRDEYIMLRLRLKEGVCFDDYYHRFGEDFAAVHGPAIARMKEAGLITVDQKGIYPTVRGFDLQNTLIRAFI